MKETLELLKREFAASCTDADKRVEGENKAAGSRSRKTTVCGWTNFSRNGAQSASIVNND